MIKTIFYYIISNAISRGAFILYSPILLSLMSLENFGLYNLIFILSMLIAPVFAMGGGSVILREGVYDNSKAYYFFTRYLIIAFVLSFFSALLVHLFDVSQYHWFLYSILFSIVEVFFLLILAYIRTIDKPHYYLYISILKFVIVLFVFIISYVLKYTFEEILLLQFSITFFTACSIIVLIVFKTKTNKSIINDIYPIFLFGLMLIPHGLSQWIMSSSDRVLIKYILTDNALGIYSIGYIMASILLLINSGIGLALPQIMIKDYDKWIRNRYDIYWIKLYAIASFLLLLLIELFFIVDQKYFHILKYYTSDMYLIFSFAYLGISILGFYYFYANYLFYFKKSKTISKQTFFAASANIVLTIILLKLIGVVGAAVATMFSYYFYLYLVKKEALLLEPKLNSINTEINHIFYKLFLLLILTISIFFKVVIND